MLGFISAVLRVAPDALPPGRVRLDWVEVDGSPYPDFDPDRLLVRLPDAGGELSVCAHLSPVDR